jgi:hypothetical protein
MEHDGISYKENKMRRYYTIMRTAEEPKVEIKEPKVEPTEKVWPARATVYASGEAIAPSLPNSYQLAQNCGNCAAYSALSKECSAYSAPVLTTYWCHTWKGK